MEILHLIATLWMPFLALAFISQLFSIYLTKLLPAKFPERFSAAKARKAGISDFLLVRRTTNSRPMKNIIAMLVALQVLKYAFVIMAVVSYSFTYLLYKKLI